jgi:allophycocyanin beta subunit
MAIDAVTRVINRNDSQGKYALGADLDEIANFFSKGEANLRAASTISANASTILRLSVARMYGEQPDLLLPGGNSYTSRRYVACVRDMEYFLRYTTYALVAGDTSVLDERVLNGLKETYTSLGVPIGSTVSGIAAMKSVVAEMVGGDAAQQTNRYFDHLAQGLS